MSKVAVVTGSNKGIGFAIVRGLCKQFDGDVFLTARSEERGLAAVEELKKEGLNPKFHQLDITNHESIVTLRDFMKQNYGGIDILINNAAIMYDMNSDAPMAEQTEVTCRTNFTCVLDTCDVLFPILKSGARVCHVSSMMAMFSLKKCSQVNQDKFTSAKTIDDVVNLMQRYVNAAKAGTVQSEGFTDSAYGTSKIGINAITPLQQKVMEADESRTDIVINAGCPGFVDTDMTKAIQVTSMKKRTIDEGAENPLYLALLPPGCQSPKGNFLSNKEIVPWVPQ